ncbi:hypothetical protein HMSSN036_94840 [Paenibacillus macerans]|nr:hypothetical protein HMSSN036_94840 [Paenibacillus macerans]
MFILSWGGRWKVTGSGNREFVAAAVSTAGKVGGVFFCPALETPSIERILGIPAARLFGDSQATADGSGWPYALRPNSPCPSKATLPVQATQPYAYRNEGE